MDRGETVSTAQVLLALRILDRYLTQEERRAPAGRPSGAYREFLPRAAAAGAALLREAGAQFPALGFSAGELAADPVRLREIERARAALAGRLGQLDRAILLYKERIAARTRRLHRLVGLKLQDDSLPLPERDLLGRAATGLLRCFTASGARQEARRRRSLAKNARLRAAKGVLAASTGEG